MKLNSILVFHNNYIWVLIDDQQHCVIVDPGKATPVLHAIKKNNWHPAAILLTHHHHDHVDGVKEILQKYQSIVVYSSSSDILDKARTHIVNQGDTFRIFGHKFSVISTPGHTAGHICYFSDPYLFCGDTLFSGGCGRLFECTPAQMYQSLQKINALPDHTLICCAHEYTLANIKFALSIMADDLAINNYFNKVKELRAKNQKTVPTLLKDERKINIFLRVNDIDFIEKINIETNLQEPEERFAWLRLKKDTF